FHQFHPVTEARIAAWTIWVSRVHLLSNSRRWDWIPRGGQAAERQGLERCLDRESDKPGSRLMEKEKTESVGNCHELAVYHVVQQCEQWCNGKGAVSGELE
ncbi:hypothetical protein NEUTE1DRAFT_48789, partial [Neurospora tetrasperma FGSC 2508]